MGLIKRILICHLAFMVSIGYTKPQIICPPNTRYNVFSFPPRCLPCTAFASATTEVDVDSATDVRVFNSVYNRSSRKYRAIGSPTGSDKLVNYTAIVQNQTCGCWKGYTQILVGLNYSKITNGILWNNNYNQQFVANITVLVGNTLINNTITDAIPWGSYNLLQDVNSSTRLIDSSQFLLFDLPIRAKYMSLIVTDYNDHSFMVSNATTSFYLNILSSTNDPFPCLTCSTLPNGTCCDKGLNGTTDNRCVRCAVSARIATTASSIVTTDAATCFVCERGYYMKEIVSPNSTRTFICLLIPAITTTEQRFTFANFTFDIFNEETTVYINYKTAPVLNNYTTKYSIFFTQNWTVVHPCDANRTECCLCDHAKQFLTDGVVGGCKCPSVRTSDQIEFDPTRNPFYLNATTFKMTYTDIVRWMQCSQSKSGVTGLTLGGVTYTNCTGFIGVLTLRTFPYSDMVFPTASVRFLSFVYRNSVTPNVTIPLNVKIRDCNFAPDARALVLNNLNNNFTRSNVSMNTAVSSTVKIELRSNYLLQTDIISATVYTDIFDDYIRAFALDISPASASSATDYTTVLMSFVVNYTVQQMQYRRQFSVLKLALNVSGSSLALLIYIPRQRVQFYHDMFKAEVFSYSPNVEIMRGLRLVPQTNTNMANMPVAMGDTNRILVMRSSCVFDFCSFDNAKLDLTVFNSKTSNVDGDLQSLQDQLRNITYFALSDCSRNRNIASLQLFLLKHVFMITNASTLQDNIELVNVLELFSAQLCNALVADYTPAIKLPVHDRSCHMFSDLNASHTFPDFIQQHRRLYMRKRPTSGTVSQLYVFVLPEVAPAVRKRVVDLVLGASVRF